MLKPHNERLGQLISALGISKNDFARRLGLSGAMVSKATTSPINYGIELVGKTVQAFPHVNALWLLTGQGMMFNDGTAPPSPAPEKEEAFAFTARVHYVPIKHYYPGVKPGASVLAVVARSEEEAVKVARVITWEMHLLAEAVQVNEIDHYRRHTEEEPRLVLGQVYMLLATHCQELLSPDDLHRYAAYLTKCIRYPVSTLPDAPDHHENSLFQPW